VKSVSRAATFLGLAYLLMAALLGIVLVALALRPVFAEWKNVAGEWEKYRLNDSQMKWFKSVHNHMGVPCCSISDGHPTIMERREDGIYVPDPRPDHMKEWLRVPENAMTIPPTNPIGIATVWYTLNTGFSGREVYIRCFVPESET
jgi:hypothetical protein